MIDGSREAGESGELGSCGCDRFDGRCVGEVCCDCLTAALLMMLSGAAGGSMICDVWLKNRARVGRRKVGGSRVTGARSSRTERRSALLMIVVGEERDVLVVARFSICRLGQHQVVEINFAGGRFMVGNKWIIP